MKNSADLGGCYPASVYTVKFRKPFLRGLYSAGEGGRGLIYGGKFRFKIDWASLIFGRKFTVFALFYFVFERNFQVQAPPRGGGLIFGGAVSIKHGLRTANWV